MSISLPEWARGLGEYAYPDELSAASGVPEPTLKHWRVDGKIRGERVKSRGRGRGGYKLNVADVVFLTLGRDANARRGASIRVTGNAYKLFVEAKRAAGVSEATLERYYYTFVPFMKAFPHLPRDPEPIERWLTRWKSPVTRYTKYKTLNTFYAWLVRRRKIAPEDNPMAYMDKVIQRRESARGLSEPEVQQLFSYTGHSPHMRLLLSVMLDSGLRIGEAMSLTRSDVKEDTVYVFGKVGGREVPIAPDLRDALRQLLPWPWKDAKSAAQLVRRAFRLAGLDGKRASAHTLRVTFARMWTGDKVALQGIGGWRSVAMLNHYRPYNVNEAIVQHAKHSPLHQLGPMGEAVEAPAVDVLEQAVEVASRAWESDRGDGTPGHDQRVLADLAKYQRAAARLGLPLPDAEGQITYIAYLRAYAPETWASVERIAGES